MKRRCLWAQSSDIEKKYHDEEWGVPLHDDQRLFEFLILEGAQAGLSWSTILNKRKEYVRSYDRFDASKVAKYDEKKILELMNNPGIVRNRLKINASIENAKAFLRIRDEYGSFDTYIWEFVGGQSIINRWKNQDQIPAKTKKSEAMSLDLKKRGFKFVGPTICYAFMQAVGMVNDHTVDCFRHREILKMK